MKKIISKGLLAVIFTVGLCVGCAKKPMQTVSLLEVQAEIINCSETYIECLEATRMVEGDLDRFELEIDKCVDAANRSS